MSAQTAVVIPGRFGDIANCLPCIRDIALKEGGKCAVVVSDEFESVLDGCSYVEKVVISSHFTDIQPAIEQARAMFPKVLVAKVNEKSVGVTTQCESFSQESWRQIGYLDRYEDLPLVFDRRDRKREQKLIDQYEQWKPFALVNFSGKSAPFERGEMFTQWLEAYQVIDLAKIKAHRIYDLIGLMDAAEMLVTCDTSTLHLAAASGIPTVNLIGDKPTRWHGSKPRNHSVLELRYGEAAENTERIRGASTEWRPRTWHVWSDYAMNGDALRRHQLAKSTWPTAWITFPVRENRRVMNDPMRSVPFIKDLIGQAVDCAGPQDRIVLTNADTCVASDAPGCIDEALKAFGCCYCFRRDFQHIYQVPTRASNREGRQYPGCDLFAFTVEWWTKHGRLLPDVLLGAEAWDWCLRVLMTNAGGGKFNDLIAHEVHANEWERPEHRNFLPSQLHNKALAAPFLAAHGVSFKG